VSAGCAPGCRARLCLCSAPHPKVRRCSVLRVNRVTRLSRAVPARHTERKPKMAFHDSQPGTSRQDTSAQDEADEGERPHLWPVSTGTAALYQKQGNEDEGGTSLANTLATSCG
jgi:hypothetical protein